MRRGWRVGYILGIPLRIDASWLVVFALITWSLTTSFFPDTNAPWPQTLYWVLGLITSLLFFTSVVLHELGHSIVAIRRGVPVLGITLFIFGGVAWLGGEPRTAFDELLIAIVGPVVSFTLALAFGILFISAFGIAHLARTTLLSPLIAAAGYLAAINAMLALFNLIPGFPLDGGRVLRALLWGVSRDFYRATKIASLVGQIIAVFFVATGLLWLLLSLQHGGNYIDALWLLFIGWFLFTTAKSSRRQLQLQNNLTGVRVGQIMRRNFQSLSPHLSLTHTMEHLIDPWSGALLWPVTQDGKFRGLLFRSDIESTPRTQWDQLTTGDLMHPRDTQLETHPDDEATKVFRLLLGQNTQFLPVVVGDRLVGLLFRHDLNSFLQNKKTAH